MSKPHAPDISQYSGLIPFFEDFYSLNKSKNKKFSYQSLANKLGWSAPYLNDIFKGRKRLSLSRALEFIDLLEMKGLAAERFLILLLAESDSQFNQSPVKQEALSTTNSVFKYSNVSAEEFNEHLASHFEYYILFFLLYNKGVWDAEAFLTQLTLTTKPSVAELENLIQRMIDQKRISFEPETQRYSTLANDHEVLHYDKSAPNEEEIRKVVNRCARESADAFRNYLQNPVVGKASYVNGMVSLNHEAYQEVRARIAALHNYLMELSEKSQGSYDADPNSPAGAQSRVWQYQLTIFSVFEDPKDQLISSASKSQRAPLAELVTSD